MGLDMYIYRANRVSEDELKVMNKLPHGDISDKFPGVLIITEEEYNESPTLYAEILPYMSSIQVENTYIDLVKLKKAYNIPEDAYISGRSYDGEKVGYHFTTPNSKESTRVELTYEEVEEKFTFTRMDNAYVIYLDEVYYWRKAYNIQDEFYAKHPVENCGYYKLTYEEMANIANNFDAGLYGLVEGFAEDEDMAYFYHEWY